MALEYVAGPTEHPERDWPADLPPPPLTLQAWVECDGPLPEALAVDLGLKLGGAVGAMHAAGVLHGDVQPLNVLLDGAGRPVLINHGLARPLRPGIGPPPTPTGRMASIYYAAPEVRSNPAGTEPRLDVYSLAATLIYALTGRQPEFCPEERIPAGVRGVLLQATSRDPARAPSASAFLAALANSGLPVPLRPPEAPAAAEPPRPAGPDSLVIKRRRPAGDALPPSPPGVRIIRRRPGVSEPSGGNP